MTHPVLTLRDLRKSFGATEIIRGVSLSVLSDERHAIIGPNGAGKSTLFHLISGNLSANSGEISLDGQPITGKSPQSINRLGLARSFQITNIFPRLTVYENIRMAVMRAHGLQYCFWRFVNANKKVRQQSEQLLELVRLCPRASTIAGEMSYSEQRSLEIAMTLASDPKVILLDEPMAGMSKEETGYTSALIKEVTAGRALLIVEHDMEVVFSLGDRISVLVYGEVIATGTPDEIRLNADVKEAYLGEEVSV
ncbi:ABC transporter ATP-binding protein [Pollutimonas bauzanensis]|uniref:Amino acid/amide ABC transporter ATP-binding protein 1, HAAT family (TC 3.A.1.4.-) n=1 Tax=Pollutimonas bauzanensis TaxID=658167 RepID=A0A1M5SFF2_9BURK|nr:ABC transporter ATP-binding protein [Pollutimonas bauzanensis]SHH37185.1 amino acid/amide ABC transporter ATP-binding protein 1, HAAT family (TC 3.A.1.4.-) [Pollutimonas bauzanensis]